ncbi:MAG TPA: polyketide synthase dehydratase domain-containing protein, partial [Candidatus Glassbacteria bacterium]|nr:polyketide synthase dehydratase domain-containing protein [Candidatus Glassbacteria bacterium]
PAVETMLLLAAEVAAAHPEIDPRVMAKVRFSRFLEIPANSSRVEALLECRKNEDGSILAKLLSRRQGKAMTRLQEHGEILFAPAGKNDDPRAACVPEPPATPEMMIPAAQVYRELVPFGPSYHTLQETVQLCGQVAWGSLQAPAFSHAPDPVRDLVGSPFPLDGAFHAACVLGQRVADFVPFPVGFARRIISRPTQPRGSYRTRVQLLSQTNDELLFDLQIFDDQGTVYESVTGIRMRDVSGGTIKPPEWLRDGRE